MIKVEVKGNELETTMEGYSKELRNEIVFMCSSVLGDYIEETCIKGHEEEMLKILLGAIALRISMGDK